MKKYLKWIGIAFLLSMILVIAGSVYYNTKYVKDGSLEEFYTLIEEESISKVVLMETSGSMEYFKKDEEEVTYETRVSRYFYEANHELLDELTKNGVEVKFDSKVGLISIISILLPILFYAAIFIIFILMFKNMFSNFGKTNVENIKDMDTSFDDAAGYENVKGELRDLIEYLKEPEKIREYTDSIPRGVLFEGEPGNGKTLFARIIAGESKTPFFYISGADIEGKFVSQGSTRVGEVFKQVRESIKENGKAILFIDELDAIGMSRDKRTVTETNQTIDKLLTELDGFNEKDNILVIGATNLAKDLDQALVRAGRFDRKIKISKPIKEDREKIINLYLSKRREDLIDDEISEHNFVDTLSRMTEGFSGADLARLVNDAALLAYKNKSKININLLRESYLRIVMGLPNETKFTEEDRKIVAYHESGHAVISMATSNLGYRSIAYGTIKPYGSAGGHVAIINEDRVFYKKSDFYNKAYSLLAGRAVEEKILNRDFTSGARDDLRQVNNLLTNYLVESGMSEDNLNAYEDVEHGDINAKWVREEKDTLRKRLYEDTKNLVDKHWKEIEKLATYLLDNEEINQYQLKELFGDIFPEKI